MNASMQHSFLPPVTIYKQTWLLLSLAGQKPLIIHSTFFSIWLCYFFPHQGKSEESLSLFWLTSNQAPTYQPSPSTTPRLTNSLRSRLPSSRRRSPYSTRMEMAPSPPRSSERWDHFSFDAKQKLKFWNWFFSGRVNHRLLLYFRVSVKDLVILVGLWQGGSLPC